jgi:hypothetical protein
MRQAYRSERQGYAYVLFECTEYDCPGQQLDRESLGPDGAIVTLKALGSGKYGDRYRYCRQ